MGERMLAVRVACVVVSWASMGCEGRIETVDEKAVAETVTPATEASEPGAASAPTMTPPAKAAAEGPLWRWRVSGKVYWGDSAAAELSTWGNDGGGKVVTKDIEGVPHGVYLKEGSDEPAWTRPLPDARVVRWLRSPRPPLPPKEEGGEARAQPPSVIATYERDRRVVVESFSLKTGELEWGWSAPISKGMRWQIGSTIWPEHALYVYVRLPDALEVLRLDTMDGTPSQVTRHEGTLRALADTTWSWDGPTRDEMWEARDTVRAVEADGVRVEVWSGETEVAPGRMQEALSISRVSPEPGWTVQLFEHHRTDYAQAIIVDGCVVVATASFIATGVALSCHELSDGAQRWKTHVYGIGPVDHSKYSNAFLLREEQGMVRVQGDESSGDYIEWVDPKTGRSLLNLRFLPE